MHLLRGLEQATRIGAQEICSLLHHQVARWWQSTSETSSEMRSAPARELESAHADHCRDIGLHLE